MSSTDIGAKLWRKVWISGFISEHKTFFNSFPKINLLCIFAGFVCELRLSVRRVSHHFHHLHRSIDAQVIEEGDEVFLHLDAVVIHLSDSENAHLALPPHLQGNTGTFTDNQHNVQNHIQPLQM